MKKYLFFLAITFIVCDIESCSISKYEDVDLGGGYFWIREGYDDQSSRIIYSSKEPYTGVGLEIIPPTVTKPAFNDAFIYAQSNDSLYWIIDKRDRIDLSACRNWNPACDSLLMAHVIGPLDSVCFSQRIKEYDKMRR